MSRKRSYNAMSALEPPSELEQVFSQDVQMTSESTVLQPTGFHFTSRFDTASNVSIDSSDSDADSSDSETSSMAANPGSSSPALNQGQQDQEPAHKKSKKCHLAENHAAMTDQLIQHITATARASKFSTFHPFSRLPAALQTLIWTHALPPPCTRYVEFHTYNDIDQDPDIVYHPPLPALFHTTRASRALSIQHEGGEIVNFLRPSIAGMVSSGPVIEEEETSSNPSTTGATPSFYLNFSRDIIWLPSRFIDRRVNNAETQGLLILSSIFPLKYTQRIQRLLVSWSGEDDYDGIGPVLRPYARLETLMLCMNDSQVSQQAARVLRCEVLDQCECAEKIKQVVEKTEDEETDDEDEDEELGWVRAEVRGKRKVVEVNLVLGG